METELERKRKQLLAALYRRDYSAAIQIYEAVWTHMHARTELSEADQKTVNQTQQVYRAFKHEITADLEIRMADIYHHIRKKMADIVRNQVRQPSYVTFDQWAENLGLNEQQVAVMLRTVSSLQITIGCSNCCRRCNEWALPFVRKHFDYEAVIRFLDDLFQNGNTAFTLYNASDPLEWQDKENTIADIMQVMTAKKYIPKFGLLTKIPKKTERIAETLLKEGRDIGVSITPKNRFKIAAIEKRTGKKFEVQHDVDQLEIPAGRDEDFSAVKSSITDNYGTEITPEGAFVIIPTFTSALNPTGQYRLPVSSETTFFIEKKAGYDAWSVAYFKPLTAVDVSGKPYPLETLLEPQIQNILQDSGSEDATPPGMMTLAEFFKTFEPPAVKRRKALLPSIVKEFHQTIIGAGKGNIAQQRKQFRTLIKQYIAFCRMERVNQFKIYAFSYFLNAITAYLKHHPAEREMIQYLRREDAAVYLEQFDSTFKKSSLPVDKIVETCEENTFSLFQTMMFRLLEDPEDDMIHGFIERYPARYDVDADRFVAFRNG